MCEESKPCEEAEKWKEQARALESKLVYINRISEVTNREWLRSKTLIQGVHGEEAQRRVKEMLGLDPDES